MGFFDFFKKEKKKEEKGKKAPPKKPTQSFWDKIKGIFGASPTLTEDFIEELEEVLLGADVGTKITADILEQVEKELPSDYQLDTLLSIVKEVIRKELSTVHQTTPSLSEKGPHTIMVIGVNGVGKTTSIGKLGYHYAQMGKSVILGGGDTFRAAAMAQLSRWAERSGVDIVTGKMGQDPSSMAYETLKEAQATAKDVAIIDTAGRLHTKVPLMEQLRKMVRVVQKLDPEAPHEVLLVIDGTMGQNGWQQVEQFKKAIGITGLIVTKLDSLAKGGIIIGLTKEFGIPVRYLGLGEGLSDISPFDVERFIAHFFNEKPY